jgi:TRAP-type C4-dicarboxylate transport system permease small subunit
MAMLTFFGLAYTLRERGHIRMMFLLHVLKGRRKVIYNMGCMAVGFLFCLGLFWFTAVFFWDSVVNQSQSMQITETYLAIPQAFLPVGSLFLLLQFVAEFLKGLAILKQDAAGLRILEESDDLGR